MNKKILKLLSLFFWAIFLVYVVNAVLLVVFHYDLCLFTGTNFAWFEAPGRQWIVYVIAVGGLLSVVPAILLYPEKEDPVPDSNLAQS